MKTSKIIFTSILLAISVGFANETTKKVSNETKEVKNNIKEEVHDIKTDEAATMSTNNLIGASQVESVDFSTGQKELTSSEKNELKSLISKTGTNQIHEIKVLAWADREYPADGKKATKSAVKLADERAEAVKRYLKELNVGDVDLYNMAERPNEIEKFFRTSDYDIKKSAETKGVSPARTTGGLFNRTTGHASTALIFVVTKQDHQDNNNKN